MKTILVDAWNTFVTQDWIFTEMKELLDTYPNPKVVLTNANDEQIVSFGMTSLPYPLFTLKHNPDKVDPKYFEIMFEKLWLKSDEVIYFEHNIQAVESARSMWINSYHYDHTKKDLIELQAFIDNNL